MKIALIHSHLNDRGGSQRYVIEIAKALESLGVDVDIFSYEYNKSACYPELTSKLIINHLYTREADGFEKHKIYGNKFELLVEQIYGIHFFKKLITIFGVDYVYSMRNTSSVAKSISNLIYNSKGSAEEYDLVFAHEEPISVWAAIEYKKRTNTPVYWFCYDSIEKWFLEWKDEHKTSKLRKILLTNVFFKYDKYLINKYVDNIAVLDHNMAKKIKELYGTHSFIRRGGISKEVLTYEHNNFIREKYGVDSSKIIIFSLTRFIPYRRVHDIFELYEQLPEKIKEKVFFYINAPVTDDEYYKMCKEKYSATFKSSNFCVDTSYPQNDTEMYNMYLSSDIFIFPNQDQTWGHAPLEAMSCECLAVVSDGCGIHEVIEKITPTIYEVGNIEMLKDLFVGLIEGNKYKEFAIKQKNYVEMNLTWNKICEQYIRDFDEMLR